MKISTETISILRNFATINPSINVDEKNCLKSMSLSENIIGLYDTTEDFEEFAIYDLAQFLGIISIFDQNEIDFDFDKTKECVKIKSGNNAVKYNFTDKDLIPKADKIKPSEKYKKLDSFSAFVDITKEDFSKLHKAAQIMRVSILNIKIKDKKAILTISDPSNPMSNNFKIGVKGEGEGEINVHVDHLLMTQGDYSISIKDEIIMKLAHKDMPLMYFVTATKL